MDIKSCMQSNLITIFPIKFKMIFSLFVTFFLIFTQLSSSGFVFADKKEIKILNQTNENRAVVIGNEIDIKEIRTFDFETNTSEGWEHSTMVGEQSISAVYPTTADAYQGLYSLALDVHLDDADPDLRQGVTFVMFPGNHEGRTISAWVKCPTGAKGDPNHPNGVQVFVKDQDFNSQLSAWGNIGIDIPENQWTQVQLTPSTTNPPGGYTDVGFDPTRIIIAGVKLGAGSGSQVPFQGTCYLDMVQMSRADLLVPPSDYGFDFGTLTPAQQQDKPFGHGPYWDIDSGWGAEAWNSEDITVINQQLAISADFTMDNPDASRKGFVAIELLPNPDINNKDNRVVRAEVKFDPYLGPERMLASIWVYDRRDAGPDCTGSDCKWFRGRDIWIGGSEWNELVFDLNDPDHFFTDTVECPNCLLPTDITADSFKNILKIGIQFYSNEPYAGTIFLDNVTIGGTELPNFVNQNQGFVTRNGAQFQLNGEPYRFAGNNVYYPFYKSHYMIDDVLETLEDNDIPVLRTWGFGDGKAPYDGDGLDNGNEGSAFQPEKGLYYEPTFRHFDYLIKSAGEHGIRLILPLVNYWSDVDKENIAERQNAFGGMGQYLEWCGIPLEYSAGKLVNKGLFYTNECVKQAYKDYISYMVNRVNTLTGIAYKDDPTILAWELANEPRCENPTYCQNAEVYNWAGEMSAYIKSLDANHLVSMGDEGFLKEDGNSDDWYNGYFGIDWEQNLGISTLDFGTVHLYPDHWGKDLNWSETWIREHILRAESMGKPVIVEEFGIKIDSPFDRDIVYDQWTDLFESVEGRGVDGDLVWMIAGEVNGVTEDHVNIGGKYYYPDYDGFTFWEPSSDMGTIQTHAVNMRAPLLNVIPASREVPDMSGATTFAVSNRGMGTMPWTAVAQDPWLTITDGNAGIDSGTIVVDYEANPGALDRTGGILISAPGSLASPQTLEIRQEGTTDILIEIDAEGDQYDTIQMVYNEFSDELNIVHTKFNDGTSLREVWFKSVSGGTVQQSSYIGTCYYSGSGSTCPVSIAVNPVTGEPAVAYRDENADLIFAQLTGGVWQTEIITSIGWNASLAFDPADDFPAIAFNSTGDYNLYYAKWNGASWDVTNLSWLDANFESLCFHPQTGARAISYGTLGWTNHPSRIYYLGPAGSGYVDGDPAYVGGGNSLAFDQAGDPHITYFDFTNGSLKHAEYSGVAWNTEVVEQVVNGLGKTSLAIAPDDQRYISSVGSVNTQLGLQFSDFNGSVWNTRSVFAPVSEISSWSSLSLDDQGRVNIAFIADGSVWVISNLRQNTCTPPATGDWIVTESCTFSGTATAPADVIINPNIVLTISDSAVLNIDFVNHKLLVQENGGVLIIPGGKISQ